ncbi:hypothetical protein FOZ60_013126 [Perkinsus olseni]|uniref:Uncharacterized protein n=1 Tax=Perkinsus olseni TaxID=32597 RepID=A0A7J6N9V5_PEROL|nr:hypothetical protein FOZ60_013126 [Perkinsus olseni]KAF4709660.1 hypothetical protein FOZ62_018122 [Perkinsus olseni]
MLSVILAIGLLISVNDASLPDGNFAGRLSSPYLFVDCTFVPASGVSSVHMVVGCDEQKPAAVGRFEIKPVVSYPDQFIITDFLDPGYSSMIDELRRICPQRGFRRGDFILFQRIKGRAALSDVYRVYRGDRPVLLTRLTTTPDSV